MSPKDRIIVALDVSHVDEARALIGRAVAAIVPKYLPDPADKAEGRKAYGDVLAWFAKGNGVENCCSRICCSDRRVSVRSREASSFAVAMSPTAPSPRSSTWTAAACIRS